MGATSACRRGTRLMVAGLVTWLVAFFICAVLSAPSSAHSGGKAIPLVTDFTLTPAPSGWNASVTLVDFDGGEALDAVDVRLKGAGLTRTRRTTGRWSRASRCTSPGHPRAAAAPAGADPE
jgi:hypothetical protein